MIQTLDQRLAELRTLARAVDAEIRRVEDAIRAAKVARGPKRHTADNPPPCGTDKGYHWHIRRGEPTDEACRKAHASRERERAYERRWAAAGLGVAS